MSGALASQVLAQIPLQPGLARLAEQLRPARPQQAPPPRDAMCSLFEAELRAGIAAGDARRAAEAAVALWRRSDDLARCHRAVTRVLATSSEACAAGTGSVATANRAAATAANVLAVLRARTPAPAGPRTVLAAPRGEQHLLALECLAHRLEEAGHRADVVGGLGPQELQEAVDDAVCVVLSVHAECPGLPWLVAAARRGAPGALVVVGGPGATCAGPADLVTDDVGVLLEALRAVGCPLSDREREVLQCLADGLTNAEAAHALCITPATLKTHVEHVLDKTGSSGRAAAVAVGLRNGWIR